MAILMSDNGMYYRKKMVIHNDGYPFFFSFVLMFVKWSKSVKQAFIIRFS